MNKEDFKVKANEVLNDFTARIEELSRKSEDLSNDLKVEFDEKLQQLKQEKEHFKAKMEDMNREAGPAWDDAKVDFSHALDNFKSGFRKLISIFD